ncbi:MAG: NADase-type glycan-binding domain-containing protein [Spirochaetaceae bacterium]
MNRHFGIHFPCGCPGRIDPPLSLSLVLPFVFFVTFLSTPQPLPAQEQLEGEWQRFTLTGVAYKPRWNASSVLESETTLRDSRYGPEKALDGDPDTAWVEGVPGPGTGESYFIALPHLPEALGFINGYAKNLSLYRKNYRVKELEVHLFTGLMVEGFFTEIAEFYDALPAAAPQSMYLKDTPDRQRVPLPFDRKAALSRMEEFKNSPEVKAWSFPQAEEMGIDGGEQLPLHFMYILELRIADTYPGSTWEDTCIAELWPDYGEAAGVFESEDGRSLVISTEEGEKIPSYSSFEYVLTLVETSPNYEWALVIHEPAYLEPGERAESTYAIIHLPSGRDISAELFEYPERLGTQLLPTGFIEKDGSTWVEYEDFRSGESGRLLCSLY